MHIQSYHPSWPTRPKSITAVSSTASTTCEDCIDPIYPSAEITSQCTDQCVVIACNDPNHSDLTCGGGGDSHCDFVCDGPTDCIDCNGFDEFLQCCTDYHSYFSEPRHAESLSNTTFSWDSSFDEFLCACSEQVEPHARTHSSMVPPLIGPIHYTEPMANLSSFTEPATPTAPQPRAYVASRLSPGPPTTIPLLPLACMWGDCHARFGSLTDLVGHVNLEHLRLPAGPDSTSSPQIDPFTGCQNDSSNVSCLWRDCNLYPTSSSIPSSSSGKQPDGMLNILANHLLHDHLGQPFCPSVIPDGEQKPAPATSGPIQPVRASNGPHPITPPLSRQQSPGTHRCQWQSCQQCFDTFEDLTSHITAVHVGGGKARYDCFWEGCNRNGSNGFSSKQKICRHLQSHTGHRPFQCDICQQHFSEAATLQQHMRRHTQEKPYMCDYPGCGKSFAITGALTIHKRTHNGQKPFKCKYCDKAFAESSNLSKHLRTHTGARPYACTEPGCNKSFARPDQLTRHLGVHRKRILLTEEPNDTSS
ncbi:Zinc-responsive transcriptional regulator ZAP1 [Hypsizygus marmoreus]|uniref:Zinc-responsive transcriptional regulator ZAP1 n=1 Tax=Hypsizygus marmoreus TaxID=39966 RepID=A0A369JNC6_HYPMA|nr:Zinc-responsive transcriptional regulator ZAP1 [Hypsizygus marmoreus]